MEKTGVLIVNLGTPDSCSLPDVRKYLIEFLTDGRVLDFSWWKRQILVRGAIVPKRYKASSEGYKRIWTQNGSPLKVYGEEVKNKLQDTLGGDFQIEFAMRYQNPSIEYGLNRLKHLKKLLILPLFPQYASATTGSVHQKIMEMISRWPHIPDLRLINSYPDQSQMIAAFCERAAERGLENYDHYVLSFHGLPEKALKKDYYVQQCQATAQAITAQLKLEPGSYSICFQSRLGKEPWLQPYTIDTLDKLLASGKKRLLVFAPSFVCDCLETLDEIGNEYRTHFIKGGGEALDLVEGLNDHPLWISALESLILN